MQFTASAISTFTMLAFAAIPLLALVGAVAAQLGASRGPAPGWKIAAGISGAGLALALAALLAVVGGRLVGEPAAGNQWVRVDTAGAVMLALVSFVGWVIVRYSRRYLAGDRGEARYVPALLATVGTVGIVVAMCPLIVFFAAGASFNPLLIWGAWSGAAAIFLFGTSTPIPFDFAPLILVLMVGVVTAMTALPGGLAATAPRPPSWGRRVPRTDSMRRRYS